MSVGVVLVVILIVLALIVVVIYNKLIGLRNAAKTGWAQIDVQLKRRYDLIPNLIETVKGYASHEKSTFEAVTNARSAAMDAGSPAEQAEAENILSGTLKSLFAVSEAYPDLKANQNFMQLQEELTATEGRIAYARQYYNEAVLRLNNAIQQIPGNLVAPLAKVKEAELYEVPEGDVARENVQVKF